MANEVQVLPSPLKGRHAPAVKAGGMRISKKQEMGVLERHTKKTGLEKTSAITNVAKIQMLDTLTDTLDKNVCIICGQNTYPGLSVEKASDNRRLSVLTSGDMALTNFYWPLSKAT